MKDLVKPDLVKEYEGRYIALAETAQSYFSAFGGETAKRLALVDSAAKQVVANVQAGVENGIIVYTVFGRGTIFSLSVCEEHIEIFAPTAALDINVYLIGLKKIKLKHEMGIIKFLHSKKMQYETVAKLINLCSRCRNN